MIPGGHPLGTRRKKGKKNSIEVGIRYFKMPSLGRGKVPL
jgi:hypothetical protein